LRLISQRVTLPSHRFESHALVTRVRRAVINGVVDDLRGYSGREGRARLLTVDAQVATEHALVLSNVGRVEFFSHAAGLTFIVPRYCSDQPTGGASQASRRSGCSGHQGRACGGRGGS
ncbi:MAG TPA: hypothetical protein VF624_04085, partial [Tepidisphaeraceae bacterium]